MRWMISHILEHESVSGRVRVAQAVQLQPGVNDALEVAR